MPPKHPLRLKQIFSFSPWSERKLPPLRTLQNNLQPQIGPTSRRRKMPKSPCSRNMPARSKRWQQTTLKRPLKAQYLNWAPTLSSMWVLCWKTYLLREELWMGNQPKSQRWLILSRIFFRRSRYQRSRQVIALHFLNMYYYLSSQSNHEYICICIDLEKGLQQIRYV